MSNREAIELETKRLKDEVLACRGELTRKLDNQQKAMKHGIKTDSLANIQAGISVCDEMLEHIRALYRLVGVLE